MASNNVSAACDFLVLVAYKGTYGAVEKFRVYVLILLFLGGTPSGLQGSWGLFLVTLSLSCSPDSSVLGPGMCCHLDLVMPGLPGIDLGVLAYLKVLPSLHTHLLHNLPGLYLILVDGGMSERFVDTFVSCDVTCILAPPSPSSLCWAVASQVTGLGSSHR